MYPFRTKLLSSSQIPSPWRHVISLTIHTLKSLGMYHSEPPVETVRLCSVSLLQCHLVHMFPLDVRRHETQSTRLSGCQLPHVFIEFFIFLLRRPSSDSYCQLVIFPATQREGKRGRGERRHRVLASGGHTKRTHVGKQKQYVNVPISIHSLGLSMSDPKISRERKTRPSFQCVLLQTSFQ